MTYNFNSEKFVESSILSWAFQNGWSLDVFDSKAIKCGKVLRENPGLPVGTPDLVGSTDTGLAAFVELKKPKHKNLCRLSQYNFLSRKIEVNAFCLVTDSSEHLEVVYRKWLSLREKSFSEARQFLISELPRKVLVNNKTINLINVT